MSPPALASEIDLGILSRDEEAMLPIPRDRYEQRETDFLYCALWLARAARIRASHFKPDTGDFYAERDMQFRELETAKLHAGNLARRGYALSADLIAFMRREGI